MITINAPHYRGEYEKAEVEGQPTALMREATQVKDKILESFVIKDWGLFRG